MLDERLTEEENKELLGEDVYDIHEIFNNDKETIEHICKLNNRSYEDVLKELVTDGLVSYSLSNYQHYSCIKLSTGRFVIVEHY